jgi:ATP-dependent RNA helicase DDX24/MAK5
MSAGKNSKKVITDKQSVWKTVEMFEDESFLEDFNGNGGLIIEELVDGEEYEKYTGNSKSKKNTGDKEKSKEEPKKKKQKVVVNAGSVAVSAAVKEEAVKEEEIVDMSSWESLNLHSVLMSGLKELKFTTVTPVQLQCIPGAINSTSDVIAASSTGSGKTLAFAIPILHKILSEEEEGGKKRNQGAFRALVVLPTRELAVQVKLHISQVLGKKQSSVKTALCVGGMAVEKQLRVLKNQPEIVIGTPGRLAGLLGLVKEVGEQKSEDLMKNLGQVRYLVLDEADRLTEEGHFRDLQRILSCLYEARKEKKDSVPLQTFIFSATLATKQDDLSKLEEIVKLQKTENRLIVNTVNQQQSRIPERLKFLVLFYAAEADREPSLFYALCAHFLEAKKSATSKVVLFVNAITYVYRLTSLLKLALPDIKIVGLNSSVKQKDRLHRMDQFSKSNQAVLVTTDLAARGLDMANVELVIHLQPPREPALLVHRSGRTARAGKDGKCLMLISAKEIQKWKSVYWKATNNELEEVEKLYPNTRDTEQAQTILSLVDEIEREQHQQTKHKKEKSWKKKMSEELDLELDEDNLTDEDEDVEFESNHQSTTVNSVKMAKLKELLKNPLPSLSPHANKK